MLTGQNGILNRAQEAKEKTETAQKDENEKLQGYEDIINKYKDLPKGEGTTPYLPNSTFSYKEGDLSTGLVIKDANNNEYVWVEVPKTTEVYKTAGINITDFSNEEYTKIENDLKEYTKDYKNTNYSDANLSLINQYYNMLKSVYTNGGFWIGRYEAGIEGEKIRTSHINILESDKAVIKQNKLPFTWVTRDEAQILATRMNYEGCTSSLIFGVQWDLMLKYIENKNGTTQYNLKTDSTTIGNYYNSEFVLNRGKFALYGDLTNWYNFNSEEQKDFVTQNKKKKQTSDSNAILLTTGASDISNLQNIYDIAGNVYEWILEYFNESNPCVSIGGSCLYKGSATQATFRFKAPDYCNSDIGFRIGIWK